MAEKVRWGILGNAKIAREKVIPAMQKGEHCAVTAIASRRPEKAKAIAETLGVGKVYGSYEELLADPEIDAVYNPLPNHMHVPWSIRAATARKHVLCEKPIGLSSQEAEELIAARDHYGVKIGEAFMARTHPQWRRALELARDGSLGELRLVLGGFSYFNRDGGNIRNKAEMGGGALMDIGCYPVTLSRMLFGGEPLAALASIERDPEFGTDRFTSAILEYSGGRQCVFACSTQLNPFQRMFLIGSKGKVEIEIPFNAPPDKACRIRVGDADWENLPVADQYTIQGDLFSLAIRGKGPVPVELEDSLGNMRAIEAIFRAGASGRREAIGG
jgi:predicted dehydrogenase